MNKVEEILRRRADRIGLTIEELLEHDKMAIARPMTAEELEAMEKLTRDLDAEIAAHLKG